MAGRFFASVAALGLLWAPVAAQAAERAPAPVAANEGIGGGSAGRLIIGLALFAGIVAWLIVDASDDDEAPVSP